MYGVACLRYARAMYVSAEPQIEQELMVSRRYKTFMVMCDW